MHEVFTPLGSDEPIGVVALSGPVDSEKLDRGLAVLRSWGREIIEAPNLRQNSGYLAGTDTGRIEGLVDLLDRGVRVIWAARGGYGITRILDRLPWDRLADAGAMVVGYSDVTALLNPLALRTGVVQVHGPVVTSLAEWDEHDFVRVRDVLEGRFRGRRLFDLEDRVIVRSGSAGGRALGGNVTLLAALAGTPWAPDFRGSVVFLEDVNEPLYRLDRLLTQLRSSGMFEGVKALISGDLWECESGSDTRWRQLLLEAAPDGVPVVHGLPFGHGPSNLAFPVGAWVEVDTDGGALNWGM
jgi:muramoyltetrapeptide carboxypeptidase